MARRKTLVAIARRLVRDPEHRRRMGDGIWLYLHLVDHANWQTGSVTGFKDSVCAEMMEMSVAWVRKWRRHLEQGGYIRAKAHGQYGQDITIQHWINPRHPNQRPINLPKDVEEGDTERSTIDGKGDTQSDPQSDTAPNIPGAGPTFSRSKDQMIKEKSIWHDTSVELRQQLPRETYDALLLKARLVDYNPDAGLVIVGVHNASAQQWLEHRLKTVVLRTLRRVAKNDDLDVCFEVMQ